VHRLLGRPSGHETRTRGVLAAALAPSASNELRVQIVTGVVLNVDWQQRPNSEGGHSSGRTTAVLTGQTIQPGGIAA
jgi:hypothetical protein